MKKSILFLIIVASLSGCCYCQLINQLPDQVYFVDDSCQYYLPDYTEVISVSDNCGISYFYQFPESGSVLQLGDVTEVSIVAGDISGNERTIKFNVFLVDTIPPEFHVDTVLFNSLSQYQNEYQTWHLYNWITANGDTLQSPEGFGFWGYYTATEIMNIDDPKCSPPISTFVAFEDLPDGHPLKPIIEPDPIIQAFDKNIDRTGLRTAHWYNAEYIKRQFFFPSDTYRISYLMLALAGEGSPGNLIVDLLEMDSIDQEINNVSSGILESGILGTVEDGVEWYYIVMDDALLFPDKKYCLQAHAPQTSNGNELFWWTNDGNPIDNQYLMYSYNDGAEWGYNYEGGYLFQIMGFALNN